MFGYRTSYIILRPWIIWTNTIRGVKTFFQRGLYGFGTPDTWSLDDYLLMWLPDAVDQIRKRDIGHPCSMKAEEWKKILEEMVNGLRSARKFLDCDWKGDEERLRLQKEGEQGLDLFRKHFYDLWD